MGKMFASLSDCIDFNSRGSITRQELEQLFVFLFLETPDRESLSFACST